MDVQRKVLRLEEGLSSLASHDDADSVVLKAGLGRVIAAAQAKIVEIETRQEEAAQAAFATTQEGAAVAET